MLASTVVMTYPPAQCLTSESLERRSAASAQSMPASMPMASSMLRNHGEPVRDVIASVRWETERTSRPTATEPVAIAARLWTDRPEVGVGRGADLDTFRPRLDFPPGGVLSL